MLYWERQQAAFCGIHAVNNLLQVPLFRESDFEAIADKMDTDEAKLLGMAYKPPGFKSQNVDEEGNYSIGVLCNALRKARLEPEPLLGERARALGADTHPATAAEAYVCHRANHYFALRCIGGAWFNLDSLQAGGPRRLSPAELESTIVSLAADGYTVYVVIGKLPRPVTEQPPESQVGNRGQWFDGRTGKPIAGQDNRFKKGEFAWQIGPQKPSKVASYNDAFSKAKVMLHKAVELDTTVRDYPRAIEAYKEGTAWLLKAIEFCKDKERKDKHFKSVESYLARIDKLKGQGFAA